MSCTDRIILGVSRDPASPPAVIGKLMLEAREAAGLSQSELAVLLDVDQATVARHERGQIANPKWQLIGRFSKIVGCNPLALVAPYFSWHRDFAQLMHDEPTQVAS